MAITRQNTAAFLGITIHNSNSFKIGRQWMQLAAQLKRLWWHTKAYKTILGVMLLTLVSLIFLSMHWSYRRLFAVLSHRAINSNWDKQLKIKS
ncbi:hypothetical protein [Nostoc sp. WHI]|uniref:hypothetical protein n=1 Tax=Nostoc sp. WHI TaxID=2650611 RepID=UPI0018C488C2|nr:hypothetical protein [Nostoc sp. WHI]MBG1269746.1 hypothetical protein [Nostoc sp. WHI]